MGKYLNVVLTAMTIVFVFSALPYMMPTISTGLYMPYEIWALVLLFFYLILPKDIGTYVYKLRIKNK